MNDRGQKAKHTVERHLAALRIKRYRAIVRTIPAREWLHPRQHLAYRAYAAQCCDLLGKRALARVVWPWQRVSEPKRPPHISLGAWRRSAWRTARASCAAERATPRCSGERRSRRAEHTRSAHR
jgi:hypothetical protein